MRPSTDLLDPRYARLKQFVLASKVVGTDDTPVKVLDRSLPPTRKDRIWPYVGDRHQEAVIYDYTPTRERAGPPSPLCLERPSCCYAGTCTVPPPPVSSFDDL